MSIYPILGLIFSLAILISLLFALMFSYYFLLKRISRHFPTYYKQLGSPFLPVANWSITKTIRRDKSNYRLLSRIALNIPADFPRDTQLRRQAHVVQLEIILIVVLAIISIGFSLKI